MVAGLARVEDTGRGLGTGVHGLRWMGLLVSSLPLPVIFYIKFKIETELFKNNTLDTDPPNVNISLLLPHLSLFFSSLEPFENKVQP